MRGRSVHLLCIAFMTMKFQLLMNTADPAAWETVWGFFSGGGWFMIPILLCSMIAVAVVIFKWMTLGKALVMPDA